MEKLGLYPKDKETNHESKDSFKEVKLSKQHFRKDHSGGNVENDFDSVSS